MAMPREVLESETRLPTFTWQWHPSEYTSPPDRVALKGPAASHRDTINRLHPTPMQMDKGVSMERLIVRKAVGLDSDRVGSVQVGSIVCVLAEETLADGTVRSQVGKDSSPRGFAVQRMGWVTSFKPSGLGVGPDGKRMLQRADEPPSSDRPTDSMASRIAKRRSNRQQERVLVTTVGFASSSEMSAHASAMREEAAVVEAKEFPTLEARLGQLLIARNVTDPELTRRCGAIDAKTALTAVHFRQLVRGLLSDPGLTPVDVITSVGDDGPMDVLHKKLDIDSGGEARNPRDPDRVCKDQGGDATRKVRRRRREDRRAAPGGRAV